MLGGLGEARMLKNGVGRSRGNQERYTKLLEHPGMVEFLEFYGFWGAQGEARMLKTGVRRSPGHLKLLHKARA